MSTKQLLRKISPRTVFGSKTDILELVMKNKAESIHLYNVFGIASGTRTGTNQKQLNADGEPSTWCALTGAFEAHSARTGEIFQAGVCFLPNYATDIVAGKFTGDVETVRFGFGVYAKFDEASATSYTYSVAPLLEVEEQDDPLQMLIASAKTTIAIEDKSAKK